VNAFNRVVVVVILIAAYLAVLAVAVFPSATLGWIGVGVSGWQAFDEAWEAGSPYVYVGIRVAVVVAATLVLAILLFLELRRRKVSTVQVVTAEGSTAAVATDSVSQRLVHHIDRLADVVHVSPVVVGRGRTVNATLDLETTPDIDVPMKTDEVIAVAREVVEEQMGLQLGKVYVRIRHAAYPESAEEVEFL